MRNNVKKVKVTLRFGSLGKKFYLFPSAEALYVWTCALERNEQIQVPGIEELLLEPGGFIESELRGFEYVFEEKNKFRRFDFIRLARASQSLNSSGLLVTVHSGWVTGGLLPMKNYNDSDIDIKVLGPNEGRLDFPALFKDVPEQDTDIPVELDEDDE